METHLWRYHARLCTWEDRSGSLGGLSWEASEGLAGCFAYNAAQDGDRCLPCIHDIASDDLAAFGRDCPHRNFGAGGGETCVRAGRVDASCCTDSLRDSACHYRTGITSGVLCCKRQEVGREATVPEGPVPVQSLGLVGERVSVQCPVPAAPDVAWAKDGTPIPRSGSSWELGFSLPSDSGLYSCRDPGDRVLGYFNLTVQPGKLAEQLLWTQVN